MAQLTDLDALEANAKRDYPNGSAKSDPPKPGLVEHSAHKEILALVPRLTRYARVLTRDIAAADDLVQDCIARALGKIHLWEQGTDLRAWLFTILHNQHISSTRRDARQRASRELWQSHKSLTFLPDQMMRLELRDLQRAMAKLPEEQRSVILLVGRDGLGYNEAASVVNQPVGTVRSRVSRGREALRAMTGSFPSRHSRRPRRAANLPPAARSQRAAQMKISLVAASVISACLVATSVGAQEREVGPMPQLHAVNPSMSLSAPMNAPLQEQMRQDYATQLMGSQRELLQQNPSGLGRQEQAIGRELNGYTPH